MLPFYENYTLFGYSMIPVVSHYWLSGKYLAAQLYDMESKLCVAARHKPKQRNLARARSSVEMT